uniref:Uncharacterized protein n=1 Tax=Clandestinovirus TaxID=2831644 RepID=A0A8F8KR94_9VIRU|nr:hypothetical protein KOM_12_441 [Clandestinovirus]
MQVPKEIASIITAKRYALEEQEKQDKIIETYVKAFTDGINKVASASIIEDIAMQPNIKEMMPRFGDVITDVYVPVDITFTIEFKDRKWSIQDNSVPYFSVVNDGERATYYKLNIFEPCWPIMTSYQTPLISVDKPCRVYLKHVFFDTWERHALVRSQVIARVAGHPHLFSGGKVYPKRLD